MGRRGPQRIDIGRLRGKAYVWSMWLLALRDGSPGLITKMKYGVPETRLVWAVEVSWHEVGHPELIQGRQPVLRPMQFGRIEKTRSHVVPPTRESLKGYTKFAELVRGKKDWHLVGPGLRLPHLWERLKKARSADDVRSVARSLRQRGRLAGPEYELFRSHAEDLLRAKRLPDYPRSNRRPTSDDKRIHFFAKVLAGLEFGIAPATATKRIKNSVLPVRGATNWAESYKQFYGNLATKENRHAKGKRETL